MKTEYTLKDSVVYRGEAPIADYSETTGVLDFRPDGARYRAVTVRKLRALGFEIAGKPEAPAVAPPAAPVAEAKLDNPPEPKPEPAPVPPTPDRGIKGNVGPNSHPGGNKVPGFPDGPSVDRGSGDKDPVFVDWMYAKDPVAAEKYYVGRKTHLS